MFAATIQIEKTKPERESIHSGHFMVSQFEAEEQDDEDEIAIPVPEVASSITTTLVPVKQFSTGLNDVLKNSIQQHLEIDTSLSKLFQCMTLAYRQKLTSPKWNRFRGIRLRWKEKIRLNNVIWRCWHLQFIKKENTLICQFASPLDVDQHNKPEAVVLEGKYWKRKLHAVTAEYKKWRLFHRQRALGQHLTKEPEWKNELDLWSYQSPENVHMLVDEDYMGLMSDTLFSTIQNQPFPFPDSREIAKAGLADFIQPSLGPLQPNLEDYMDTFDQEFVTAKLPTVPEEQSDTLYKEQWPYSEIDLMASGNAIQDGSMQANASPIINYDQSIKQHYIIKQQSEEMSHTDYNLMLQQCSNQQTSSQIQQVYSQQQPNQQPLPQYEGNESKTGSKSIVRVKFENQIIPANLYNKANLYGSYQGAQNMQVCTTNNMQMSPVINQGEQLQNRPQENFKLPSNDLSVQPAQAGYKFSQPSSRLNLKFTSQAQVSTPHQMHSAQTYHSCYNFSSSFTVKEDKTERTRNASGRGRPRSRSTTRETVKPRPPLVSAISDPALITPNNSVLLTQLLTTSSNEASGSQNSSTLLTQLLTNNSPATSNLFGGQNVRTDGANIVRIKEETVSLLSAQPSTTLIVTSPVTLTPLSPTSDPLCLNSYSNSNSPIMDSAHCLNSPTSSQGSMGSPNRDPSGRDHRKVGHIHAEHKRRVNIKNGFDMIHSLIPHLNQNPNAKLSKAAMLQKGAEYIRQLRQEREQLNEEMNSLRQQIETLNTSISNCQSMLPTNLAPISIRRDGKMQEMFDEYVKTRTADNWKFWIFSLIFKPLLVSFNNVVSTSSLDDLYRSTILWVEQHCTLGDLRPVVLNSLRYLCTKTEMLSEPEKLPDEAKKMSLSKQK